MNVVVDLERCQGHGKCYLVVPAVFEPIDDWGHAGTCRAIPEDDTELQRLVQRAIDGCPERALSWAAGAGPDGGTA